MYFEELIVTDLTDVYLKVFKIQFEVITMVGVVAK
jgi:hypothetical protein